MISVQSPQQQLEAPSAAISAKDPAEVVAQEVAAASSHEGSPTPTGEEGQSKLIVASPYLEREHLLDLDTLDAENALFAQALAHMTNTRPDYATAPYVESFNWEAVMEQLAQLTQRSGHRWRETSFFVVAFRSRIPPTTVYEDLGVLDKAAHAEAMASGGFLKYWFGNPDSDGRNLATCVWRSLEDAKIGSVGPEHARAAGAARALYTHWKIDRLRFIIRDDLQSWDIVNWVN